MKDEKLFCVMEDSDVEYIGPLKISFSEYELKIIQSEIDAIVFNNVNE